MTKSSNTKSPTKEMFVEESPESNDEPQQETKEVEEPKVESLSDSNILDLPSKGKLWYPSQVSYRDILVKDTETLAMSTADTYSKTLNGVLKSVLNNCDFYEDMTIFDRDYVLVWLWANNFSSTKQVEVTCPGKDCGTKTNHTVDLRNLPITEIRDDIPLPMKLTIQNTNTEVAVRLNTVSDEILVENFIKENGEDTSYETLMLACSIEMDIDIPFKQKLEWIKENVNGREMGYVKAFHHFFKYGVDSTVKYECSKCGEVTSGRLPFQAEDILFPALPTDFEEFLQSM